MKLISLAILLASAAPAANLELVSVKKIWDKGAHNAFTDLVRFKNRWYCTFRESEAHVGGDGIIRVLRSKDGEKWESAALIAETGIDLRDPKFSITPDNRLMIVAGGSVYGETAQNGRVAGISAPSGGRKVLKSRRPRVMFSKDGAHWTAPEKVLTDGEWLWRVTWHGGKAYGVSYNIDKTGWQIALFESLDGLKWTLTVELPVSGRPNETTVRFLANGDAMMLVRREAEDKQAWIGTAKAPYREWKFTPAGFQVGGPNFIQLPDGSIVGGGRDYRGSPKNVTMAGMLTPAAYSPALRLPSGGDNSYPGFVWYKDRLWTSYYSSHEGKTSVYLAKIALR